MVGGVKLNLTEFTWFASILIFTDHYLFQCLKAFSYEVGYPTSVGYPTQVRSHLQCYSYIVK